MHSWEDIEENRCFSNGGTNLHIHAIAQGRPEDNQVEFLQGPHGIVNSPKNLVLNNIRRFTQMANGLQDGVLGETGYGCHTFYITDVFRNIVIIADIRHLLCLNIVSCAHINMQFVIFTS